MKHTMTQSAVLKPISEYTWYGLLLAFLLIVCSGLTQAQMSTPSNFQVTPSGAATYSIPIKVPPGVAGMEPKLALTYSSQAPNGTMGVGWSLSGFSAITRCGRTPASDGVRSGVNLDANDRFCLDGQRLILVSGTYGAAGSEYRTELESFTKITALGQQGNGPQYFEAKTKSGLTINYGGHAGDANGRMEASATDSTVIFWGVKYYTDTKGQIMHVGYLPDTANRQLRPDIVLYAHNGTNWNAWVNIIYESRTDVSTAYLGSTKIVQAYRITELQVYQGGGGGTHVRSYKVNYGALSPTTNRSRVASIQECVPPVATNCLPPLTFNYPGGTIAANAAQLPFSMNLVGNAQPGDFNGDGKSDLFALQGEEGTSENDGWMTGTFCAPPAVGCNSITLNPLLARFQIENGEGYKWVYPKLSEFRTGDVNGDGYTDILIMTQTRLGSFEEPDPWLVKYYFCPGPGITTTNNCVQFYSTNWNLGSGLNATATIADFDGDGRADIIAHASDGTGTAYCAGIYGGTPGTCVAMGPSLGYKPQVGDFNGDGKSDLYLMITGGGYFCAGNGASTLSGCVQNHGANWTGFRVYPGDYNGDGVTDLFLAAYNANYYCQGTSLTKVGTSNCVINPAGDWSGFAIYPGDYNGDGQTDFFLVGAGSSHYCRGLSDGATCQQVVTGNWAVYNIVPGDYNGRGVTDLMLLYGGTSNYLTTLATVTGSNTQSIPDLLESVSNGLGGTTTLTYKPITTNGAQGGVYWKETILPPYGTAPLSAANNTELRPPMYVVQDEIHSNGIGGTNTMRHHYSGAMFNREGRGFLGYWWHQTDNWSAGSNVRTQFRQDYPFIGLPFVSLTSLYDMPGWTNHRHIIETNIHYRAKEFNGAAVGDCGLDTTACAPTPGKRYFPFAYVNDDFQRDLNNGTQLFIARNVQYSYDNYGNLLTSHNYRYSPSWTFLGYDAGISNEYSNDPNTWILGRLLRSTVSKTCPDVAPGQCN